MKKSLLLLMMCVGLNATTAWAQDDDVYFVPSKHKAQKNATTNHDDATARYDSYNPVATYDNDTEDSNWAEGRGNGHWDVDTYNRRGKNYKGQCDDNANDSVSCYDQGYADGYEDGKYTQRIVRFYSPRPGVYVSSPYYLDCFDFYFDPWYYGYAAGWAWSGWWGWGSWYGWRPYYSSWHWGWGGWYDPWWGWPSYAWYPHHWHGSRYPAGAERGPRGGYIAYGGRRGATSYSTSGRGNLGGRPSQSFGRGTNSRGTNGRSHFGIGGNRPSRSFGDANRPSRNYGNSRNEGNRNTNTNRNFRENNRSFNNRNSSESRQQRSFSQPSRSGSFNRGGSFGGSRGGFSGGSRGGFGGGGRSGRR